jgi:hypothetical protein
MALIFVDTKAPASDYRSRGPLVKHAVNGAHQPPRSTIYARHMPGL